MCCVFFSFFYYSPSKYFHRRRYKTRILKYRLTRARDCVCSNCERIVTGIRRAHTIIHADDNNNSLGLRRRYYYYIISVGVGARMGPVRYYWVLRVRIRRGAVHRWSENDDREETLACTFRHFSRSNRFSFAYFLARFVPLPPPEN